MKRVISTLAAIALVATMVGSASVQGTMPDWADKSGGFGVGGETTLGGTHGLNLRYYISNQFGLQLTFGLGIESATVDPDGDNNTVSTSSTTLGFGLYGMYKLAFWQRGHLSAIFGIDIQMLSESCEADSGVARPGSTQAGGDTDASGTDILIGLGLHGEWFPTQYLSLFGQVGLRLDFIGAEEPTAAGTIDNTTDDVDFSGIDLALGSDLLGAFGFTVWFN